MSLLLALAVSVQPVCNWDDRGVDKYKLPVPDAVATYTDIPADVRAQLKARMEKLAYDDVIHVSSAGVTSDKWFYENRITDMHFGDGKRLCGEVVFQHWKPEDKGERALVYTVTRGEQTWTVVVFTVCRNVSRAYRKGPKELPKPVIVDIPPIDGSSGRSTTFGGPMSSSFGDVPPDAPPETPVVEIPVEDRSFSESTGKPNDFVGGSFYPVYVSQSFAFQSYLPVLPMIGQVARVSVDTPSQPIVVKPVPGVVPAPLDIPIPSTPKAPDTGGPTPGNVSGSVPGNVAPIPEPSTILMMALGLAWVGFFVRRNRKISHHANWAPKFVTENSEWQQLRK